VVLRAECAVIRGASPSPGRDRCTIAAQRQPPALGGRLDPLGAGAEEPPDGATRAFKLPSARCVPLRRPGSDTPIFPFPTAAPACYALLAGGVSAGDRPDSRPGSLFRRGYREKFSALPGRCAAVVRLRLNARHTTRNFACARQWYQPDGTADAADDDSSRAGHVGGGIHPFQVSGCISGSIKGIKRSGSSRYATKRLLCLGGYDAGLR
jgi:hypothetical protein